ncbi:toxin-antitoxin system YwqK family antitoxin [Paraburkholderia lycopersici]|uniref:Antitoxin component YwqK of the YwqJK toxin-antitoxin module n=1 Tax=Paraburkholderia lycopersici TaxID=416944 RepID=A0A1G6W8J6_9BURK|nr:toxin-antitoxin system YwqK family antitoxin [Paraburkholderia lycopersici]SDD62134.1 Antitoxin component YwqK of the YwqJK toxin-antitoxin module [Paraburkholderia lycopersici]
MSAPMPAAALLSAASGSAEPARAVAPTVVETRDSAGALVSRVELADGVPHGESVQYAPNGTALLRASYAFGLLDGTLRTCDAQGRPVQEAQYRTGQLNGAMSVYQDGRLAGRQQYVAGVLHGESVTYAPSGLVTSRMSYESGKLEREAIFLHDGVVVRRARYAKGRLEGETREYAADGTLAQSLPYQMDLLHGTARRYASDGTATHERVYRLGKPQGDWRALDAPAANGDAARGPRIVKQLEKWVRG